MSTPTPQTPIRPSPVGIGNSTSRTVCGPSSSVITSREDLRPAIAHDRFVAGAQLERGGIGRPHVGIGLAAPIVPMCLPRVARRCGLA